MPDADRHQRDGRPEGRREATQIVGIGTAAGSFSALFGVGGGTVMVPLLVLWRGLGEKKATGTSLLAIVVIACYAVASYGIFGHVDLVKGLLIGIPAVAGVVFGTWLQQRIADRTLSGMFALLMVAVIVLYLTR
jgi:uncharacterized membrane protein YfcA